MRLFAALLIFCSAFSLALTNQTQAPITLRLRFSKGAEYSYTSTFELDIPGAPKPKANLPLVRSINAVRFRVEEVRRNGDAVMSLIVYPRREQKPDGSAPKSAAPVKIVLSSLGDTTVLDAPKKPAGIGLATNSAAQGSLLIRLPLRAISVGDSWTTTVPHPLDPKGTAMARLTFERVDGVGAAREAVLREELVFPISLRGAETGIAAPVDVTGTVTLRGGVRIQLSEGRIVRSRLEGGGKVSVGEGAGSTFELKLKMALEQQPAKKKSGGKP